MDSREENMTDAENQQLDPDVLQAAEEIIRAGYALLDRAEALETRADFVHFVGALRQHLADYLPASDTLRVGDYLGALSKVAGSLLDEYELESRDTPTWSLFGTILVSAYFETDRSPRPLRIPGHQQN
jgi:hypothetical protein